MKAGRVKHSVYPTWKKYGGQFGAAFCAFFSFFFFKSPFLWVPKADWRLLVIFHKMCVYVCVRVFCVCDCSRKCRLKKGRWRQMGEVGGRCSQKTWKSTLPPPPLTRLHALLAHPHVKITQFALSQVTEMQSSRDLKQKGGGGVWRQMKMRRERKYFRVTVEKLRQFPCLPTVIRADEKCIKRVCVCCVPEGALTQILQQHISVKWNDFGQTCKALDWSFIRCLKDSQKQERRIWV